MLSFTACDLDRLEKRIDRLYPGYLEDRSFNIVDFFFTTYGTVVSFVKPVLPWLIGASLLFGLGYGCAARNTSSISAVDTTDVPIYCSVTYG